MQHSTFVGLDVHEATISVAVAQRERDEEIRHRGTISDRLADLFVRLDKLDTMLKSSAFLALDLFLRPALQHSNAKR